MPRLLTNPFTLAFLVVCVHTQCRAQVREPNIKAADLPLPTLPIRTGPTSESALSEIAAAASASVPATWAGIDVSGTVLFGNSALESPVSMTLTSDGRFRLDAGAADRPLSLRYNKGRGNVRVKELPLRQTAAAQLPGPFALPTTILHLAREKGNSLVDQGNVTVEGLALHRITLVSPILSVGRHDERSQLLQASDFYIESTTHHLIFSVQAVQAHVGKAYTLRLVAHYSNYELVDGASLPFDFDEMVEGHTNMRIHALSVTRSDDRLPTYFSF